MIHSMMLGLALTVLAAAWPDESLEALHIALTDQDGRPASLVQFHGHPVLITMFYGSCPQACPLLISKMKLLEKELKPAQREDLRVVLVSLDPQRDTPEALRLLARSHGVDQARWRFLRTDEDSVRLLAAVLGVKYHPLSTGAIWHGSVITVLDREGRVVGRTEGPDLDLQPLRASLQQAAALAAK